MLSGFGIEGDSADDISLSYLTRLEEEAEQQAAEKEKERREKEEEERVTAEATRASRLERNRSLFFPALSEAAEGHLQDVLRWRAQWKAVRSDRPDGLKRKDLGTLLPQSASEGIGWLNDEVVNEYLGSLVSRVKETRSRQSTSSVSDPPPPAWAVNSNWYNQIRTKGVASVSRWARRAKLDGERLLEAEVVLIPVNSTGNHWTLLVIRPKARSIEYLDSMGGGGSGIINAAKEYLAMTLGAKYNASEWSVETGRSPLQANGVDCGVFVCYNGLAAALGVNPTDAFTADDMARGRRVIAATLLHGSHTGPFDLPSRSRLTGA
ncbi:hypothetical protein BDY21DRAFT_339555 [Lineolata rhizophorae]|uniref:Ubiquitin-like protease family profile domain-containing protein n=1 Tax=Lineolata rhizophorae TaxID=578093 RepID=A0A6A6P4V5_9PEZI|nr:hypothetical protein BDY21DRAFT_339555 [Lineolata rhizophorae]